MDRAHGIIPARAGFTIPLPRPPPRSADHPRSRGVYGHSHQRCACGAGSSPLARGLPQQGALAQPAQRIIPARAGFTSSRRVSRFVLWDHPRSRGVYRRWRRGQGGGPGSSPLARGLHDVEACGRPGGGIIPARAGFTSSSPTPTRPPSGSSPLARGLLTAAPPREPVRGIIPARAGFTTHRSASDPHPRDHPRSRGVYSRLCVLHRRRDGSSPLARGLPVSAAGPAPWSRIIPARAGFTHRESDLRRDQPDHPRSRGVYRFLAVTDVEGLGSSPLARGLRSATQRPAARRRIIPARAGFTASATWWWRSRTDHPRSRGVYGGGRVWRRRGWGSSPLARGLPGFHHTIGPDPGIIPARAGFTWSTCARSPRRPGSSPLARGLPGPDRGRGE